MPKEKDQESEKWRTDPSHTGQTGMYDRSDRLWSVENQPEIQVDVSCDICLKI